MDILDSLCSLLTDPQYKQCISMFDQQNRDECDMMHAIYCVMSVKIEFYFMNDVKSLWKRNFWFHLEIKLTRFHDTWLDTLSKYIL